MLFKLKSNKYLLRCEGAVKVTVLAGSQDGNGSVVLVGLRVLVGVLVGVLVVLGGGHSHAGEECNESLQTKKLTLLAHSLKKYTNTCVQL